MLDPSFFNLEMNDHNFFDSDSEQWKLFASKLFDKRLFSRSDLDPSNYNGH